MPKIIASMGTIDIIVYRVRAEARSWILASLNPRKVIRIVLTCLMTNDATGWSFFRYHPFDKVVDKLFYL